MTTIMRTTRKENKKNNDGQSWYSLSYYCSAFRMMIQLMAVGIFGLVLLHIYSSGKALRTLTNTSINTNTLLGMLQEPAPATTTTKTSAAETKTKTSAVAADTTAATKTTKTTTKTKTRTRTSKPQSQSPPSKTKLRTFLSSTLHWETIEKDVLLIQNDFSLEESSSPPSSSLLPTFCLPWTTNSDVWWTHNPIFVVVNESPESYCFQVISNAHKRQFLHKIYLAQFQGRFEPVVRYDTRNNTMKLIHPDHDGPQQQEDWTQYVQHAPLVDHSYCNTKGNMYVTAMYCSGWGADWANVQTALMNAHVHCKILHVEKRAWHYAAPDETPHHKNLDGIPSPSACPSFDQFCYFLNITHCPQAEKDYEDGGGLTVLFPSEQKSNGTTPTPTTGDLCRRPVPLPGKGVQRAIQRYYSKDEKQWMYQFLTRPQTWLRKRVFDMIHPATTATTTKTTAPKIAEVPSQTHLRHSPNSTNSNDDKQNNDNNIPVVSLMNGPLRTPCTVLHVRRSDVVLHGKYARRYHALAEYLNETRANLMLYSDKPDKAVHHKENDKDKPVFRIHPNLVLLTDDANAIEEALTEHNPNTTGYHWMYWNRKRFRGTEGGWERQVPSHDPITEVTTLLATFRLVTYCDNIVHSHSSFGAVLTNEMIYHNNYNNSDHAPEQEERTRLQQQKHARIYRNWNIEKGDRNFRSAAHRNSTVISEKYQPKK